MTWKRFYSAWWWEAEGHVEKVVPATGCCTLAVVSLRILKLSVSNSCLLLNWASVNQSREELV